jgi:phosphoglycerate kinase
MTIKSIRKVKKLANKTVLVRVDFNVPLEKAQVKEDYKLRRVLPTINWLVSQGAKVVLLSHLGRPKKRDDKLNLKPIAKRLAELLDVEVVFSKEIVGPQVKQAIKKLNQGEIILLDNIRFLAGEKKNSKLLAKQLASLADIYVNDAFAVSHRMEASVAAIKTYIPSYAGLLLEEEVSNLFKGLKAKKPLVAVIGGVKVESKIKLLENLIKSADFVVLGGALANTFLLAQGLNIGKSLMDDKGLIWAKKFMTKKIVQKKLILPTDALVISGGKKQLRKISQIKKTDIIFDIGPETIANFCLCIKKAKTIIWNGPMGKFEDKRFKQGTLSIARQIAISSTKNSFSLVGGGETVEALANLQISKNITWISTGGGAMLQFLAGEKMPGLDKIVRI